MESGLCHSGFCKIVLPISLIRQKNIFKIKYSVIRSLSSASQNSTKQLIIDILWIDNRYFESP